MRQYIMTAKMCFREKSYFGLSDLAGQYLLRALSLGALLAVWRALFGQGVEFDGLSLPRMLSYTLLSAALDPVLNVQTPASSWLHDGTILGLYQRPSPLFGQLMAHTMGGWVMPVCLFSLPALVVGALCGIGLQPASAWFYLSLPLSISQGFAVDFLFACFLIQMKNLEWSAHALRMALTTLFTGALIPFAALPWGLGNVLSLSPLGTLAGAPLSLFTGLDAASRIIPAQIFWNLTLWPLALYWFSRSRERMVSYGG